MILASYSDFKVKFECLGDYIQLVCGVNSIEVNVASDFLRSIFEMASLKIFQELPRLYYETNSKLYTDEKIQALTKRTSDRVKDQIIG